jgi:hypothetical protein
MAAFVNIESLSITGLSAALEVVRADVPENKEIPK